MEYKEKLKVVTREVQRLTGKSITHRIKRKGSSSSKNKTDASLGSKVEKQKEVWEGCKKGGGL